jgi:polyribonucleotide nucleotidyltransferase
VLNDCYIKKTLDILDKKFTIEFGNIAKKANGSCIVKVGETIVLVTVVISKKEKENINFIPLTVDYRERTYAAGKIPGGFFKREARPKDGEILISRLIDRSIRPIFPKNWKNETQVSAIVLSHDCENDSDIASILGASVALYISDLPFITPVSSVRIIKENDNFVVNPLISVQKTKLCTLDIIVSGTEDALTMVEAGAYEVNEIDILKSLNIAKEIIKKMCIFQKTLFVKEKNIIEKQECFSLTTDIEQDMKQKIDNIFIKNIEEKKYSIGFFKDDIVDFFLKKYPEQDEVIIINIFEKIFRNKIRNFISSNKKRIDGRKLNEIRKIICKTNFLPRTHGSSLFTRGETQSLATVTLGTLCDMQTMNELISEYKEHFIFHYNFPGFATGDLKNERSVSRREIGHGNLAKKALIPILPDENDFGYTIRIVSDILESNGSSSMASVCSGSLALFNAGVPIKSLCSGIAMGLIKYNDNNDYIILTDISGIEDHFGDMDLKVAGTRNGITALQMDIKTNGIDIEIISNVLEQARIGRLFILDKMDESILYLKNEISSYAPKIAILKIPHDKIGELIGPGGKNIRKIQEMNNVKIDIDDTGKVFIYGDDSNNVNSVKKYIELILCEIKIGEIYESKIIKLVQFGAFAEILPGKDGLIHISQISKYNTKNIGKLIKKGDKVKVKVIDIDKFGKISLSII